MLLLPVLLRGRGKENSTEFAIDFPEPMRNNCAEFSGTNGVDDDGDGLIDEGDSTSSDLDCDGVLNGGDIDPFFLGLGDPSAYRAAFPNCELLNGDINGDGALNGGDIDPFFQCLGGGCP